MVSSPKWNGRVATALPTGAPYAVSRRTAGIIADAVLVRRPSALLLTPRLCSGGQNSHGLLTAFPAAP